MKIYRKGSSSSRKSWGLNRQRSKNSFEFTADRKMTSPMSIKAQKTPSKNSMDSIILSPPIRQDIPKQIEKDLESEGSINSRGSTGPGKSGSFDKSHKPEDAAFIIRDTTTGLEYDIRDPESLARLESNLSVLQQDKSTQNNVWQDWWKTKKENNANLLQAAETGDISKIDELLNYKTQGDQIADINIKNAENYTPLHFVSRDGNLSGVKLLLARGANVNALTINLRTPLHIASVRGYTEIIKELLENGANPDLQDNDGNTAIHLLSEFGWNEGIEILLKHQPGLTILNKNEQSAYDLASNPSVKKLFTLSTSIPNAKLAENALNEIIPPLQIQQTPFLDIIDSEHSSIIEENNQIENEESHIAALKPSPNVNIEKIKKVNIEIIVPEKNTDLKASAEYIQLGDYTASRIEYSSEQNNVVIMEPNIEFQGPIDFTPMQLIGKGAHGEVYAVRENSTGIIFAMKVLNDNELSKINLYSACVSLQNPNIIYYPIHPFIVELEKAFQMHGHYFFLTEYCPGGDIARILEREQKFTEDRAKLYAAEILLAIENLHHREITISNLTSSSILLDEDGHAMLGNFGLSYSGLKEIKEQPPGDEFSVAYVPEILKGQTCSKSTDWYCFGVFIHEMLTGKPPFWSRTRYFYIKFIFKFNREQTIKNISAGVLKLPTDLSKEAKNLLFLLLNRNPAKRLGASAKGACEIKSHPWFSSINWEDAKNMELPVPYLPYKRAVKENQTWNSIGTWKK